METIMETGTGRVVPTKGDNQGPQVVCIYKDFTDYESNPYNGSRGVISLTLWFEKTESVFEICDCPEESKVKFAPCTFTDRALSWLNGHVKARTILVAN